MTIKEIGVIVGFALVGWLVCGATIGLGFSLTSETGALILHAIVAPVTFAVLAFVYAKHFGYTSALTTAVVWLALVMALDLFVVALLVKHSFAMFRSVLGTWLPFALIFLASWVGAAAPAAPASSPAR
ncbi:MAG: hypothetical protein J2P54_12580 [Bradyrhizobiaceae bacterium]|nr:hypothetical protein [Bradyrhizobiaceae bacterium]